MHANQTESSELLQATTAMVLKMVVCQADYGKSNPAALSSQAAAMAQCLMQVARTDPTGLKAEVSGMSTEDQQTVQALLRAHMSAAAGGAAGPAGSSAEEAPAKAKIELKLTF